LAVILLFFLLDPFPNPGPYHMLTLLAAGAGLIPFLVGLGLIINARWFTVPVKALDRSQSAAKRIISAEFSTGSLEPGVPPSSSSPLPSVTEGTTRQLK
jgi:hypothetical protein